MTASATAPAPRRSQVRYVTSILVGATLVAAVVSSAGWALVSAPSERELREASAELVQDRAFASVDTLHLDSSGLGPREVRGTFAEPIELNLEPADETLAQRIRIDGEAAGWAMKIVRGPDEVSVEARRGGRLADITDRQLDLEATAPLGINIGVGAGAVAGGLAGAAVNRRRQRRTGSATSRRWRLAVATGLLPVFAVLAVALPFYLVPANSTLDVGDYGSGVFGVLILLAGVWVPVALAVALVVWLVARGHPAQAS